MEIKDEGRLKIDWNKQLITKHSNRVLWSYELKRIVTYSDILNLLLKNGADHFQGLQLRKKVPIDDITNDIKVKCISILLNDYPSITTEVFDFIKLKLQETKRN